jgi:hypothetical protein
MLNSTAICSSRRGPRRCPFDSHHQSVADRAAVRGHRRSNSRRRHPRSHHPQRLQGRTQRREHAQAQGRQHRPRCPHAREGSSTKRNRIRINARKGAQMIDVRQPSAHAGGSTGTARARRRSARTRRVARGSLLLTSGTASHCARRTRSFRSVLRALDPGRKTRTTSSRPAGMPAAWPTSDRNGSRLQIGTGGRIQFGMHGRLHRNPQAETRLPSWTEGDQRDYGGIGRRERLPRQTFAKRDYQEEYFGRMRYKPIRKPWVRFLALGAVAKSL